MWNSSSADQHAITGDPAHLFPPQRQLLDRGFLTSHGHWVICAPTGCGKTRMGEWAMLQSILRGGKAIYMAPLKAIVGERLTDWQNRFPEIQIGLFTGDRTRNIRHPDPKDQQLLLFTPEKLGSMLHNWKTHLPWISRVGTVVVDELHLIGDTDRGGGLEGMLTRLLRINPLLRVIGLSGTLANHEEITRWLKARLFHTEWRPVPVVRRVARFKKAGEKPDLLLGELKITIAAGGKSLVFVNSRRRAETLCAWLEAQEIRCAFHHAGLDAKQRKVAQDKMLSGNIDVLVATSSLEMGVNFPARKVVIYDTYTFDGETFGPMPVSRYLQAAGRAGRAGFDTEGEAVLFQPHWAGKEPDYERGHPEPVKSSLFKAGTLTQQVLAEIGGRLSISEEHLQLNFAYRTLWHGQGGRRNLEVEVSGLISADLVKRDAKTGKYLSETALGRIACQMVVSPKTILWLRKAFDLCDLLGEFDLLLLVCTMSECTPKLGFNFEEIDAMTDTLLEVPSYLLDSPSSDLTTNLPGLSDRSLLAALKSAVLLYQHTQGVSLEELAERYDAYPNDIRCLKDNATWVLAVALRVFSCLASKQHRENLADIEIEDEHQEEKPRSKSLHECLCRDLTIMLEYGIPRKALSLAAIAGIGSKRGRLLMEAGIHTPKELLAFDRHKLGTILRMKDAGIKKVRSSARCVQAFEEMDDPFAIELKAPGTNGSRAEVKVARGWPADIDPYRLRRALELNVDFASGEVVLVSGGSEPHRVCISEDARHRRSYGCDCADFAKERRNCKHVLRARLELGDDTDLQPLLRLLTSDQERPLRYSLGELWMKTGRSYDAFNDRSSVDYTGQRFLRKASTPPR
jgi:helicase